MEPDHISSHKVNAMGGIKTKHELLMELVASHYQISIAAIRSKLRDKPIPEARQVCSLILKLNTKMTLNQIADAIGYKSHASPIRDIRIINSYIDIYPAFRDKINPLMIAAKQLSFSYDNKTLVIGSRLGEICWFWNEGSKLPLLGTLEHSYYNEDKQARFVSGEYPGHFSHCEYAGVDVIPECFFRIPVNHNYAAAIKG